jgi:uncharacterized protein (TIRG00374 family)
VIELDVVRTQLDTTARASLTDRDPKRRTTRKVLGLLVLIATLVVEIALIAPYVGRVTTALRSPDVRWLLVAVMAELVSMGAFARAQRRMLRAGGARVAMRRMVAVTYAANAVSVTLPAGTALAAGYVFKRLRSWGATVPAATFTLLASGILSTLSFALLTLVCALLVGGGALTSLLAVSGVAVVACAALLARRLNTHLAIRIVISTLLRANRILRRAPDAGVAGLRRIVAEVSAIKPRPRDWLAGFSLAELNWLADLGCLVACCDAVGTRQSSLLLVTVAFIAGTTATSLTFLPGGLGVTDAAMIFTLTQGGVSTGSAAAAVLLYRLISFALVVALGWLIWVIAWIADQHRAIGSTTGDGPRGRVARYLPCEPTRSPGRMNTNGSQPDLARAEI